MKVRSVAGSLDNFRSGVQRPVRLDWLVGTQFDLCQLHHALWTTTDYFEYPEKARIWRAF